VSGADHHTLVTTDVAWVLAQELGRSTRPERGWRGAGWGAELQYADYARWQRSGVSGEELERALSHTGSSCWPPEEPG